MLEMGAELKLHFSLRAGGSLGGSADVTDGRLRLPKAGKTKAFLVLSGQQRHHNRLSKVCLAPLPQAADDGRDLDLSLMPCSATDFLGNLGKSLSF